MTDDQVLAKVRAAADLTLRDADYLPYGSDVAAPVCARAALAMVEQYEDLIALANAADDANRDNFAAGRPVTAAINGGESSAYRTAASRILSALRTAVGE